MIPRIPPPSIDKMLKRGMAHPTALSPPLIFSKFYGHKIPQSIDASMHSYQCIVIASPVVIETTSPVWNNRV